MFSILGYTIGFLAFFKIVMAVFEWVMINKSVISTEALGFKIDKLTQLTGLKIFLVLKLFHVRLVKF